MRHDETPKVDETDGGYHGGDDHWTGPKQPIVNKHAKWVYGEPPEDAAPSDTEAK